MHRNQLSKEARLILFCSVEREAQDYAVLESLVKPGIDWKEVLYQLTIHRVQNIFTYNMKQSGLFSLLDPELQKLFNIQWKANGIRNNCYKEKLVVILDEFAKRGLVAPVLKGNLLASLVYPAMESRIFNDLDLLIRLPDVAGVTAALEKLGYIQGHYDKDKKRIIAASRREKMLQQMSTHELQEFQMINDNVFAPLIQVDINHDILWKGKCPYHVPSEDLIGRAVPVALYGDTRGYMLDYIDNIIQLSCHLYKEATLMIWVSNLRDLRIYKFADIFMYIKKFFPQIQWNVLLERVKAYNLEKILYYAFYHIELMFGELLPREIMAALKPADPDYLDYYAIESETPRRWQYPFLERLFDAERIIRLQAQESDGMQRFLNAKQAADGVFSLQQNL